MSNTLDLSLGSHTLLDRLLADPKLPSPPMLALQIIQKVNNPDCELDEVSNLLTQDSALCGKLLKTVNSVCYATSHQVTSIRRAILIVGFNRLRMMILGLSLPAVKFNVEADPGLKRYWKSSVTGALIAHELAAHLRLASAEDDLIASLLRDLGMLLLRQVLQDAYWPVWSGQYGLWGSRQSDWEKRILGFDHAEVSARLLEKWGLPREMVEPIRYHHDPMAVPGSGLEMTRRAHLLDLASRLALLAEDDQPAEVVQDVLRIAEEQFNLDFATLEELLTIVHPKVEEFAAVLHVDIGSCPNLAAVLEAGHQEMARLSLTDEWAAVGPGVPVAARNAAAPPPEAAPSGATVVDLASPDYQWGLEGEYSLHFTALLNQPNVSVRLRDYELIKELGRGATAVVFQGLERALNRLVAIKMMMPEQARSANALRRFAREARLAAAIRHENVVTMFAVSEVHGVPFLVMECVPGRSLQDWLDSGRVFTVPEIVRTGYQLARGLAAAHALRLIHRDIKPANVLLEDQTERVRISDFGLARDVNDTSHLTADGDLIGTPLYMSPEQVDGHQLGAATDLFSMGSLLYMLCTGQAPFQGPTIFALLMAIPMQTPKAIRDLNPKVPEWLATFIASLHAKKPADRPTAAAAAAFLAPRLPTT